MKRITFGLVSLTLSLLFAAQGLGLLPDRDGALLEKRVALCEALAIECSKAAQVQNTPALEAVTRAIIQRNPEVVSAAVRTTEGKMVVGVGDHETGWVDPPGGTSTATHMIVPVAVNDL